ncbi:probable serine/threonine-protein kinase PBL16 [Phoenix dactylifera]|uniref:Probable serine/threonine-protein kinase PBL16 n=1 Tax=Phoenix dactylifera TaxID=42345 RepID=A0A8B7D1M7_PHODC|nr:probable serine/threonine-protein kinase PBL16 [Phoenix dactylifera]XP_038989438.1 probable serine/threonine-protein kinase PBL16 [Phoenix dactylifera]
MEQRKNSALLPSNVVIVAYDATRVHNECELQLTVKGIRMRGDILNGGDTLVVLGVLHTVTHPMGYQIKACTDSFFGTNSRALEEEISRKLDLYESMLLQSAEQCKAEGVSMIIKITAGIPTKVVILQEVVSSKATWVILDRHLRKDLKFYVKHIPCKVALIQDSLSVEVMKPFLTKASNKEGLEQKSFYSDWRTVGSKFNMQETESNEQCVVSSLSYYASSSSLDSSDIFKYNMLPASSFKTLNHKNLAYDETESLPKQAGKHSKGYHTNLAGPHALQGQHDTLFQYDSLEKPILCAVCGLKSILYVKESMRFRFSEIQAATSDFSKENFLGEGGFGHVYKGRLKDGQIIAAKMRKEASTQGYSEFFSEVHILSFARHRNIVMLLGYCCKENHNILVYEYICNKSLEWHLFSQSAHLLEWHKRHAMAIGIAKGLRFLHEECRGGPIIHRDLRPSNILLTHDFVPMLGDFGLARWKSNNDSFHTRVLGASGYLAPEYAEHGIVSVRTDVYAFGIVLFQLISGRRVVDEQNGHSQHLLKWAGPLVESLALHELIDPRVGESYDTYELYHLARAAFLCVRRNPEMRPSMGEVVRLLEADNDHARDLAQQFIPHYTK